MFIVVYLKQSKNPMYLIYLIHLSKVRTDLMQVPSSSYVRQIIVFRIYKELQMSMTKANI